MKLGEAACHLGFGLVAGLVGTAVMTAGQLVEMRIRGRKVSTTPAKAIEQVFGLEPVNRQAEERLSTLTHWGYGTSWGTFRSVLGVAGIQGPLASILHTGAISGTAMVMLPGLKLAPPAKEWGAQEIAIDLIHHAIYAFAVGTTYEWLCRSALQRPVGKTGWNVLLGGLTAVGLQRLSQSFGKVRPAPSRLERTRRAAIGVWQGDWPRARHELTALRR